MELNKTQFRLKPFGWTLTDPVVVRTFDFENIDTFFWQNFLMDNMNLAFYTGAVYICVIFGLQKWMRCRPAYQLKLPLFLWNLTLGLFSIVCCVRIMPAFIYTLQQPRGLYSSICYKQNIDHGSIFWMLLFLLSKFVELGDTVFIVLRKRPLIFLQWYHHLVTMSVAWIIGPMMEPFIRWTVVLNAFVHSLMYPYFALKIVGARVPLVISKIITTLQFTQMIIALAINMASLYFLNTADNDCVRYPRSIQYFGMVYATFVVLFGKLFYDSVWQKDKQKSM